MNLKQPSGIQFMLFSALSFALMAVCVKLSHQAGIPVFEIIAARAVVSVLISYVDVKRKGISLWGNNKPLLLARGIVGTLSLMCVYYAVTIFPLAEATILQYTHPVFTAVLAFLLLKERISSSTFICIVFCFVGLYLIVQPSLGDHSQHIAFFNYIIALSGAFGSAIAYVIVRKLSRSEDSSVIIFYFPMIALPVSLLLLLQTNHIVIPQPQYHCIADFSGYIYSRRTVGINKSNANRSRRKGLSLLLCTSGFFYDFRFYTFR